MPTANRNITHVVRNKLCTMCGTCYAVCPRGNIEIPRDETDDFVVRVRDASLCERCGLCDRACPGARLDLNQLNEAIFGRVPDDAMIGVYRKILFTRSTDDKVRHKAASGGTVGALMRYLLEKGLVDGVLTSRIGTAEDPFLPHSFVARKVEDIQGTEGSIYQVFPVNAGLRGALKSQSRLACVGLGCQIRGLRKAGTILKRFREGISLTIGLICGHNASYAGTHHLLSRLGVCRSQVARLQFRAGAHPGRFRIDTKEGHAYEMTFRKYTYMLTLFEKYRCGLCTDLTNAFADISTGDGWLPERQGEGGWNVTLVRTEKGEAVLDHAARDGVIEMRAVAVEDLKRTQALTLYRHTRGLEARTHILRFFGRPTPEETGVNRYPLRGKDYLNAIELLLPQWFFRLPMRRRLFEPLVSLLVAVDEAMRGRKDRAAGRSKKWIKQLSEKGKPGKP